MKDHTGSLQVKQNMVQHGPLLEKNKTKNNNSNHNNNNLMSLKERKKDFLLKKKTSKRTGQNKTTWSLRTAAPSIASRRKRLRSAPLGENPHRPRAAAQHLRHRCGGGDCHARSVAEVVVGQVGEGFFFVSGVLFLKMFCLKNVF